MRVASGSEWGEREGGSDCEWIREAEYEGMDRDGGLGVRYKGRKGDG